jgi:hypothetical protein
MKSRDFVYWLQGYFELTNPKSIGEAETTIIRNHLNMVFVHEIDPSHGDKKHQEALAAAHGGQPVGLADIHTLAKFNC